MMQLQKKNMLFMFCKSNDGVLYKRMLNGTQLRCLKKDEVMREIHAGVYDSHMNGIILAKKIVRQGYY